MAQLPEDYGSKNQFLNLKKEEQDKFTNDFEEQLSPSDIQNKPRTQIYGEDSSSIFPVVKTKHPVIQTASNVIVDTNGNATAYVDDEEEENHEEEKLNRLNSRSSPSSSSTVVRKVIVKKRQVDRDSEGQHRTEENAISAEETTHHTNGNDSDYVVRTLTSAPLSTNSTERQLALIQTQLLSNQQLMLKQMQTSTSPRIPKNIASQTLTLPQKMTNSSDTRVVDDMSEQIYKKLGTVLLSLEDIAQRMMSERYPVEYKSFKEKKTTVSPESEEWALSLALRQSEAIRVNLEILDDFLKHKFPMSAEKGSCIVQ